MESTSIKLKIQNISKTFYTRKSQFEVIKDVSLDVKNNEMLIILGPGHCGKSVLMNIISKLVEPTSGNIILPQEETAQKCKISMVFQKISLMPWKTVMENVEFGIKFSGENKVEYRKKAQYYIDLVGLQGFENAYPHQLSGGMKQRVGIARAYVSDPDILLMDEPFGQLDAQTRYAMENEILKIWENEKRTIIFVTNNIEEAIYLGDRIVLLSKCPATVKAIYDIDIPRPRNMVAPEFLKIRELISGNMDLSL